MDGWSTERTAQDLNMEELIAAGRIQGGEPWSTIIAWSTLPDHIK